MQWRLTFSRIQRDHQILGHHRKDKALLDVFLGFGAEHVKMTADHTDRHLDLQQGQATSRAQARSPAERGKDFVMLRVFPGSIVQPAFRVELSRFRKLTLFHALGA